MGHRFFALVDKHFPKDHKLRRIFNRNTIKISYSCMNNTKQIINNHKKRILNSSKHINDTTDNTNTKDTKNCSCQQKITCPLNGNCLQSSLIYEATITRKDNSTTETYIRLAENNFKTRYRNHTTSFQHTKHRNSTKLSKHIWTLKEKNIDHFISWHILSSRSPYNSASKRCNLCFKEKLLIICQPELSSLNKSNELVYCVTIEQSIEIYHILQISIIGVDMSIMYIIHIYIYIYMFLVDVYFGIYGNNRNPGDEKMARKRKSSLHYNKVVYFTVVKKKRERLYTSNWAL